MSTPEVSSVPPSWEHMSFDELARRQGVKPVRDVASMARPGVFESDEEHAEFLRDLYASRRSETS